jgi:hypothetical protein
VEKYSEAFESPGPALAEARKKLSVRSGEALKEADATSSVGSSEADASPSAGMLTMVLEKAVNGYLNNVINLCPPVPAFPALLSRVA